MACEDLRVHHYFDRELAPSEMADFELHLAGCFSCRRTLEELRWLDQALRAPAAQMGRPRWVGPSWWVSALAAVFMVALLGWGLKSAFPAPGPLVVELAGSDYQVTVQGGQLLEMSVGDETSEQRVELKNERMTQP